MQEIMLVANPVPGSISRTAEACKQCCVKGDKKIDPPKAGCQQWYPESAFVHLKIGSLTELDNNRQYKNICSNCLPAYRAEKQTARKNGGLMDCIIHQFLYYKVL